ncbi:MAG: hypothetical protein AB1798_22580 [Spirochaetota bacterium]
MKKMILIIVVLSLVAPKLLFCEETSPQIAFRLLDGYVREKEESASKKTGAIITMVVGGLLLSGAGVMWFAGDKITASLSENNKSWDTATKYITCGALAGSGAVTFGVGTGLLVAKPVNYRQKYSDVYETEDPVIQEALAAATLQDMAVIGKRNRLIGGFTSLAWPVVATGVKIGANLAMGLKWYDGVFSIASWQIWGFVSGFGSLFRESDQERLYKKYLAAKEVLYVTKEE